MIDFAALKGLTIPEGVVVKIEVGGVVLWEVSSGDKVILEVEKITSNTYAGSKTYKNESFVLFDIYPKSGGTVNITYGDLTKTITDDSTSEEPNAQQVFFGTFNGVSDVVETPSSGRLTIEGDYRGFSCGAYSVDKSTSKRYLKIIEIVSLGAIEFIPGSMFGYYDSECSITEITVPPSVTLIEDYSLGACNSIERVVLEEPKGWYRHFNSISGNEEKQELVDESITTDPEAVASYLKDYPNQWWTRE